MFNPKVEWLRIKGMDDEPRMAAIRALPRLELLQLLRAGLEDLNRQLEKWPELIYDGMDKHLANDEPSKAAAEDFLARLRLPSGQ